MSLSHKEIGLYSKFYIERVDGRDQPGGDRENAIYYVLDLVHDEFAKVAMAAYAEACIAKYPLLAQDIQKLINE
jgi:cation transport regulator ChaC